MFEERAHEFGFFTDFGKLRRPALFQILALFANAL
jgi:hypothetical protein